MQRKTRNLLYGIALAIVFLLLIFVPWLLIYRTAEDISHVSTYFSGVAAFASMLTAVAIIAAFGQVREARKQLADNRNWNKMSFALTYLPSFELFFKWEADLDKTFVRLIQRNEPLSEPDVKSLFADEHREVHLTLKTYMNALEGYCVAINSGLASEELAKRIWGYKLVRHFIELQPYIVHLRTRAHDNKIYCELEKVFKKWSADIEARTPAYGED